MIRKEKIRTNTIKYRGKLGKRKTNKMESDWRLKRITKDWIGETTKKRDANKKSREERKNADPKLFKEKQKQYNAK